MNKIFNLLNKASNITVDIVDDQVDFAEEIGALAITPKYGCKENASEVIAPTNKFIAAMPKDVVDAALIKFDTHFADEYKRSPEAVPFPNPHCLYGTPGWNLAINAQPLVANVPTYMLAKNEFDMWGTNPTGVHVNEIKFTNTERKAYDNLFKVIPLKNGDDPAERLASATDARPREAFMDAQKIGRGSVVILFGVASDVCDSFAMAGYLNRGATVIVAEDLTRGIGAPTTAAPRTGSMAEVVDEHFAKTHPQAVAEGRLVRAQSSDILAGMQKLSALRKTQPQATRAALA